MAGKKVDLLSPIYHDEDAARQHLEALLWPHGPVCPRCGVIGQATLMKGKTTRPGLYSAERAASRSLSRSAPSWSGRTSL